MRKDIVIFDFDETLISLNSFPVWIRKLLLKSVMSLRYNIALKILFLLFERKILCRLSHADFKARMLLLDYPSSWDIEFSLYLRRYIRPSVYRLFSSALQSNTVVVSSAAPLRYLEVFFEPEISLGKEVEVFGSFYEGGIFFDNHKENKVSLLKRCLYEINIIALYTDSFDDFALANISAELYLVHPKSDTLTFFQASGLCFNLIKDEF